MHATKTKKSRGPAAAGCVSLPVTVAPRGRTASEEGAGDGEGERALMRAVLHDAILCLAGLGRPRRDRLHLANEAMRWVLLRDTSWPFSFESICDVLGIDAPSLRRRLLRCVAASPPDVADSRRSHPAAMVTELRSYRLRGNTHMGESRRRARQRRRHVTRMPLADDPAATSALANAPQAPSRYAAVRAGQP